MLYGGESHRGIVGDTDKRRDPCLGGVTRVCAARFLAAGSRESTGDELAVTGCRFAIHRTCECTPTGTESALSEQSRRQDRILRLGIHKAVWFDEVVQG